MLAYGAEAVVPLENFHVSLRVQAFEPETNKEGTRLALDLIDEVKDEANAEITEHKKRASFHYDQRVNGRFFKKGDLVLRKVEASGIGERGKLMPNWEGPYRDKKTFSRGSYKIETLDDIDVPRTWHALNLKVYYV
ncbi:uncharacterized protein LOC141660676 [Apium graveolens]|uniref:uncharacterized protein LOC141660676 n=1 Tax=Apium graveolens TaxID=4045 RepID=UPI003D79101C